MICLPLFDVIDVINTDINVDIKNIFLEKKLEEERIAKQIAEEKAKQIAEERRKSLIQKAKISSPKKEKPSVFTGSGRKLSDSPIDTSTRTMADVREARLKHLEARMNSKRNNNSKDEKKDDSESNTFII